MTSKQRLRFGSFAIGVCTLISTVAGCSDSEFPLAPAAGRVTIGGAPLTNAKVMFAPVATGQSKQAGQAAFGRLDDDGRFELGTNAEGDGAVVGPHWATIINLDDSKRARFDRIAVTERQMTVVAGQENEFLIELTEADLRRFAGGRR